MEYLLIALVAFYLGWRAADIVLTASFSKILEELKVSESDLKKTAERLGVEAGVIAEYKEDDANAVDIKIEQHQGRYYAYRVDGDEFVAQGDTPENLLSQILERLPAGSRVTVDRSRGGDIMDLALAKYTESKTS
jgi:hypothetical protein